MLLAPPQKKGTHTEKYDRLPHNSILRGPSPARRSCALLDTGPEDIGESLQFTEPSGRWATLLGILVKRLQGKDECIWLDSDRALEWAVDFRNRDQDER